MANQNDNLNNMFNIEDQTAQFDPNDIQQNKTMALLAYLSWLVLVPLLAAPQSKFARFHANQGLVLAIAATAALIVCGILTIIPFIGLLFILVETLVGLACLGLAILGIINAVNGQAKELPVIGKIKILK